MRTPREVLTAWVAAYNARDADVLAALYEPSCQSTQVAFGEALHGREAVRADARALFRAFPDIWTRADQLFEDGEWGIIEWQGGGTFLGPSGPHAPTGRSYSMQGCGFFHIPNGLIRTQRGYFDRYTWFSQVGLPFP
jgi:steroid delta-isomerase-like uncharacterized protein